MFRWERWSNGLFLWLRKQVDATVRCGYSLRSISASCVGLCCVSIGVVGVFRYRSSLYPAGVRVAPWLLERFREQRRFPLQVLPPHLCMLSSSVQTLTGADISSSFVSCAYAVKP